MSQNREKVVCPFCEGEEYGCCFCDHDGWIYVGPDEIIKSKELVNSLGVQYLKEEDPQEIWPEMYEFFMDESNIPQYWKDKHKQKEHE